MSSTRMVMRTIKPHQLAPKSILDRRKAPSKRIISPSTPPSPAPQSAFRRRAALTSTLRGIHSYHPSSCVISDLTVALPIASPITYLTVHEFPSMKPKSIRSYPSSFLRAPMRRDILHRAVVYEANAARGTGGHTKTRGEVRGSTRKIRQQKGTGMARVGARVAPGRRGGGIVFGPRRRSFATKIQNKVYALAYRTAISHRFAQSQLHLTTPQFFSHPKTKALLNFMRSLKWTRKAGGGTLFITGKERRNLVLAARHLGADVMVKRVRDIKVRDLLLMGRIVFERGAFEWLLRRYGVDKLEVLRRDPIRDYEKLAKLL